MSRERVCGALALLGAAISLAGLPGHLPRFFAAWLTAWFYWFSIAIGGLGFLMIHRLTGGDWGATIERVLLSGLRTFLPLAVLFLPLLAGFGALYPWARAGVTDATLLHKAPYLNVPFWCARALIYFATWVAFARAMRGAQGARARHLSAIGLIVIFVTVSFASFDWIMSLEPLWYSTVYGLIILTGQGLAALSFALFAWHALAPGKATDKTLRDLGNLVLTASILWTYTSFVQWLIIWIGNIPETVTWYVARSSPGWVAAAWVIFLGLFAVPFQLLIWRSFKERPRNLAALGVFVCLVYLLQLSWLIAPGVGSAAQGFNLFTIGAWLAVGGVWGIAFLRGFAAEAAEVLAHG